MSGNERRKYSIKKKILPKQWDSENQRPRKSFIGSPELSGYLSNLRAEVNKIESNFQQKNITFTLDDVIEELDGKYNTQARKKLESFFPFADHYLENSTKNKRTVSGEKSSLKHVKEFQKIYSKRIDFDTIDKIFYDKFLHWMQTVKLFSANNTGKVIKHLKVILNRAYEEGINQNVAYRKFKKPESITDSIYLNSSELKAIENIDLSECKHLQPIRDLFLIGCFTGLRWSDFGKLHDISIEGDMIKVIMQKTQSQVTIPMHQIVKAIIARYGSLAALPRISYQKTNDYIKELGEKAGITEEVTVRKSVGAGFISKKVKKFELITTHTARRSFATNLYLDGYPTISIMKITGHKTEKDFMKYIRVTQLENAQQLAKHWDLIEQEKNSTKINRK